MPSDKMALCILEDGCVVEYDRQAKWLTLFLAGGPRRNLSPVTVQKLSTFLSTSQEKEQILDNEYMSERADLYNQHASHYVAKYDDECLTLSLDTERLEFTAYSTRLLREFLEKELKSQEAQ